MGPDIALMRTPAVAGMGLDTSSSWRPLDSVTPCPLETLRSWAGCALHLPMEAENKDVMLFDPMAWRHWKGVEIIWRSFVAEAPF